MQLIGGEPQLSPHFGHLLAGAKHIGYGFVEVFSNLTHLSDETLDFAAEHDVAFATSVYSHDPAVHDRVTKVRSSHERTVRNLRRLVERGVTVRAAVIAIDQGQDDIDRTKDFLHGMGVGSVRVGDIREFGRAQDVMSQNAQLSGLCGHCWRGRLCVSPDGTAAAHTILFCAASVGLCALATSDRISYQPVGRSRNRAHRIPTHGSSARATQRIGWASDPACRSSPRSSLSWPCPRP